MALGITMTALGQSELRIRVAHDHDGECSVIVSMRSGPFCGRGRAWLNIADVSEFATSIKHMAATSRGEASLRGGYLDSDGSPNPTVDVHLVPHGQRGHILVTARLASDPADLSRNVHINRMSGAVIAEPAGLERFAIQLSDIPKGAEVEAVVPGESAGQL